MKSNQDPDRSVFPILIALGVLFWALFAAGCSKRSDQAQPKQFVAPKPKVTQTVTTTTKIETPVPVYQTQTQISSKTTTSPGAAPLHKAEVIDPAKAP